MTADARLTSIGTDQPLCPYCGQNVQKVKGYRNCPHCGKYIHAGRRPLDEAYVMYTDEENLLMQEQWAIARGKHQQWLEERARFVAEAMQLKESLGREPTEYEVKRSFLHKSQKESLEEGHFGGYTGELTAEAKEARIAHDWNTLLKRSCEAAYLSANGPQNNAFDLPARKRFNAKFGHIQDATELMRAAINLGMSAEDLELKFIHISENIKEQFGTRVQPQTVWKKMLSQIKQESNKWVETGSTEEIWWI